MLECKPVETPMESNSKVGSRGGNPLVNKGIYQRLVGRLIYLSHLLPDIAFSVSVVSQFTLPLKSIWKQFTKYFGI